MNRAQKVNLVSSMRQSLTESNFIILLHYRGLSDQDLYNFRVSLKSENISLKIIKNTLAKVAVKDSDLEILSPYLTGPTAICYANDPISLAKVVIKFTKENEPLTIQAAYFNKSILLESAVNNLSKLGSLEEVRSSFLSILKGSQSKFVRVLNSPASSIISVISNYADSKQ